MALSSGSHSVHAPASFSPPPPNTPDWLGELDRWLLAEGQHRRPWLKLGAHPTTLGGVDGTAFAVWAPTRGRWR